MMVILSHRGYWKDFKSESNKKCAFERSFDMGFGTETDVRDIAGELVISHDMPVGGEMSFEELLILMGGRNLPLALNIKADGLATRIEELLAKYHHTNYFTFDMSVPELVYQVENTHLNVYTGYSDILKPVLLSKCKGVWLDSFFEPMANADRIYEMISCGKKVCVVSEDLHDRSNDVQWKMLRDIKGDESKCIMLCTNYPENAARYFL